MISFTNELLRKALHLLSLVVPVGLLWVGRPGMLALLVPLTLLSLAAAYALVRSEAFHRFIYRRFSGMMRAEESPQLGDPVTLNGAVWVLVASVLTIVLFPPTVAAAALIIFLVGDAFAAIIGRPLGRTRLGRTGKSLEGTLAFIVTAFAATLPVPGLTWQTILIGALVGAGAELLPGPVNDNLRIPLLSGLAMLLAATYLFPS